MTAAAVAKRCAAALVAGGLLLCAAAPLPARFAAALPRRLQVGKTPLASIGRADLDEQISSTEQRLTSLRSNLRELLQERQRRDSLVFSHAEVSWEGSGRCGVATNMLDHNQAGMQTFCQMNLDFWWNWAPETRNAYQAACAHSTFVPMIWGWAVENSDLASRAGKQWGMLMGYNEPDLYGPPPNPGDDYLSSGTFAPTFHCGAPELALNWQQIVMAFKQANPNGVIVSPAMADPSEFASTGGDVAECNASPQMPDNHMRFCTGWMKCFKENVMHYNCGASNCWDVIDVLQFHAYEYHAERLIGKVQRWEATWADDLDGLDGRTRKTLWLTEFAHAGTTDSNDPSGEARAFMTQSVQYMKSSRHVSGWSWFSQDRWASFETDNVVPASPFWSSALITSSGEMTPLGETYAGLCGEVASSPEP